MRITDLALRLLGATSGEQIIKAAAAASGAITLPAGTTDFSGTGGTSQVVKQTTAGGAFTVGQVAATEVSGLAGLTADALIKGGGAGAAPVASTATVDGTGNLTVAASIAATGTINSDGASALLSFDDRTTPGTGNEWAWYAQTGSARLFRGADILTVSSAGRLSAQTATIYKAATADPLIVQTDSTLYCRTQYIGNRTWTDGVSNAGVWSLADETAAALRLAISTTGACTNTTGTWAAISDVRLKKDIAPYERGLDALLRINPVSFRFNGRGLPDDQVTHYGLVADDVASIVPEIVGEIDLATGPDIPSMVVKTVDPGRLTYALINAVKELSARIETLEAALEARGGTAG